MSDPLAPDQLPPDGGTNYSFDALSANGIGNMSRFFFDLQNGDGLLRDTDGHELPDRAAVRQEIAAILRDVVRDELDGNTPFDAEVTVRDEQGSIISSASLSFRID